MMPTTQEAPAANADVQPLPKNWRDEFGTGEYRERRPAHSISDTCLRLAAAVRFTWDRLDGGDRAVTYAG